MVCSRDLMSLSRQPSSSIDAAGSVRALWRYPVKSMRGEELDEGLVSEGGILGDRSFAVIDRSNGKVASAKLPVKWAELLGCSASFVEGSEPDGIEASARITLPDGAVVSSADPDLASRLSDALGRTVDLAAARPESPSVERLDPFEEEETIVDIGGLMMAGRFSDYAAVHLVTIATLERLGELYPEGRFDLRRFRPNIVVATSPGSPGFIENDWVGRTIAIGDQVRLRISDPTPRCAIPTLAQGDLPADRGILRTIAQHNRVPIPVLEGEALPSVGVYAFVVRDGIVRRGDAVRVAQA